MPKKILVILRHDQSSAVSVQSVLFVKSSRKTAIPRRLRHKIFWPCRSFLFAVISRRFAVESMKLPGEIIGIVKTGPEGDLADR